MSESGAPAGYFLAAASAQMHAELAALAQLQMVFFAGLPGTGKSLFVHQLTHLAQRDGRVVHLLQWDVARPVFEASAAGQRYPLADGITHVLIRHAVGLWAREAVLAWSRAHSGPEHLLIGETPLIGSRLIELVSSADDEAEAVLTSESCSFVLPVPSTQVRRHIESERERRSRAPVNARELEDASPFVMRLSWRELVQEAAALGIHAQIGVDAREYDDNLYRAYYKHLLKARHLRVIEVDTVLPTRDMSVYDYAVAPLALVPAQDEAERWIRLAESQQPSRKSV